MDALSRICYACDLFQQAERSFDAATFKRNLDFSEVNTLREFGDVLEAAIKEASGAAQVLDDPNSVAVTAINAILPEENYLLDEAPLSSVNRPRISEFAGESGLSWFEAATLVSVGANGGADYRDWDKIMASPDPVRALSRANDQLFDSQEVDWAPNVSDSWYMKDNQVIARSGNYVIYQGADGQASLRMVDGSDRLLGSAGVVPRDIEVNAFIHGFDTQGVRDLADDMEKYNPVLASEMRSVGTFSPSVAI